LSIAVLLKPLSISQEGMVMTPSGNNSDSFFRLSAFTGIFIEIDNYVNHCRNYQQI
jgi:hypothetical protein